MLVKNIVRAALWLVLAFGLLSGLRLSYLTLTSGPACPNVGPVYICHIISLSYFTMCLAQFGNFQWNKTLFYTGWVVTFVIAALATVLELINGDTCPRTADGLPMCYISLALCLAIIVLYRVQSIGSKKLISN
jgi:hypothetical protein